MSSDPLTIYQDWVDTMCAAIQGGALDVIAMHVALPYLHRSQDARIVIETRRDMEKGYRSFINMLQSHGVNQFIGLATSAEYLSDDYIEGVHIVHSLRNAAPVLPAYSNRTVLRRGVANWKLSEVHHGFSHGNWPVNVIHVGDDLHTRRSQTDDARRQSTQPLALYQRFLNALTRANATGDLDAYCRMCDFPYSSHSASQDLVVEGVDGVRPFFDGVSDLMRENRIEEFARIADRAEFLSGSSICGYHTCRFMRGGTDALEPVRSRMILNRIGTQWFLKSVTNAVKDCPFPYSQPVVGDDLVTDLEIQRRTKT